MTECADTHRFFVAEVVGVEVEGKVVVLALCTGCGQFISKEFQVAQPLSSLRLGHEEKTKKEK